MKSLRLLLLLCCAFPAWGGSLFVVPFFDQSDPITVNLGNTFDLTVEVRIGGDSQPPTPDGDMVAYQFDINLPTFLSVVSVTDTGYFASAGDSFFGGFVDDGNGVISFILNALNGTPTPDSGLDSLVTIRFQANGAGTGTISTANELYLDSNFNAIPTFLHARETVTATTGSPIDQQPPPQVPEPAMITPVLVALGIGIRKVTRKAR